MSDEVFDNDYSDFSRDTDSTDSSGLLRGHCVKSWTESMFPFPDHTYKECNRSILQLAADAVSSEVAAVLVRDGNEGGLKFLTAISDVKEELLKLRIPPGKVSQVWFSEAASRWRSPTFQMKVHSGLK